MSEKAKLLCEEGEIVEVDKHIAMKSKLVAGIIDDSGIDDDIPVPQVSKKCLLRVIEYLVYIDSNEQPFIYMPLKSGDLYECTTEWFAKFVDVPQAELFELMLAANFLDIKSLLDLCSAKLASWITSKSVEEIREFFGIENDYTPEEEAKIKEENMWAQEAWL